MKKGIDYAGIFTSGICHDGEGNVLFRLRSTKARDEHGKWDPGVGGGLDRGETLEQCLLRECEEEIGTEPLSVESIGHLEKFRILDGVETHWIGFYYKCLVDKTKVVINEEADDLIWAPFSQHPNPMLNGFESTFKAYKHLF